jgi:hypothetical protein
MAKQMVILRPQIQLLYIGEIFLFFAFIREFDKLRAFTYSLENIEKRKKIYLTIFSFLLYVRAGFMVIMEESDYLRKFRKIMKIKKNHQKAC